MAYGTQTAEIRAAVEREDVWFGGEHTEEPEWHCLRCGNEWPGQRTPDSTRRIDGPTEHGGAYAIETVGHGYGQRGIGRHSAK
jgi:hypothetical protein